MAMFTMWKWPFFAVFLFFLFLPFSFLFGMRGGLEKGITGYRREILEGTMD